MSIWTHICGIIRIDHFSILTNDPLEEEMIKLISEGAPEGSEGGLRFFAKRTRQAGENWMTLWWGFVAFEGDLRDFQKEDLDKIMKWLEPIPKKLMAIDCMIRDAAIYVECEENIIWLIYFDPNTEKWEKIEKPLTLDQF